MVREEAFSQLSRCVASFQLHSVKYAWRLPDKLERAGKIGLADFLRRASGACILDILGSDNSRTAFV